MHAAASGLLVGALDFASWVKLFGGRPPAQRIETVGGEGAGRDGDPRQHADIEQALRFWARLLNVTRFLEKKRISSNRPPGLSRSSQPAPLLSPHLLLGGELSDRETSGRAAVTVPADACGQRRIRSRTRKLPILPDRPTSF